MSTSGVDMTPPPSATTAGPLTINGMVVPTGPRADRAPAREDPFVTPTRGIANDTPATPHRRITTSAIGPEVNITPTATGFTPRPDRLSEIVSADNAQAVFPPQACVFVANLSSYRTDDDLQRACERKFGFWGRCHAKVRRDKNRMPFAFVQFEEIEHARIAIRDSVGMIIDGRSIRAEICNADRSVLITRHTGGPVSDEEARGVLEQFGAIEETCPISVADQKVTNLPEGRWVKFAYFQDCCDAHFAFRYHEFFRLVTHRANNSRTPRYRPRNSPFRAHAPNQPPNQSPISSRFVPDAHAIFIGDLPLEVTHEQIRDVFSTFGAIVSLNILRKRVEETDRMNVFAFVGYDNAQSVDDALHADPDLCGYRLRLERKEFTMRRNMRMGVIPQYSRRHQDPILVHLYNQGLHMGLAPDQAALILAIGQRNRTSHAYGNPTFSLPAPPQAPYGSSNQLYDSSPYHPMAGNVEHQRYAGPYAGPYGSEYPQLPPPSGPEYEQFSAPRAHEQYGQHASTEATSSAPAQVTSEGTTYYSDPNQPTQAMVPHQGGEPIYPIYGAGYSHHYDNAPYTPMNNPDQEQPNAEHVYSHEAFYAENSAGQPDASFAREFHTGESGQGDDHGNQ